MTLFTSLPLVAILAALAADTVRPVELGERRGRVTLEGRALADDAGPFPALGATLFWALWGEAHDAARLDANLAWLADRGVDYVRILGIVGGEGWDDRRIDPQASDYWAVVDRFVARLGRHDLRAQVTIFAAADTMMPERARREAFVDRWAARVNKDPGRFVLVEVANEHYQNGIGEIGELRELGRRLAAQTDVLVALSTPAVGEACAVYAGSAADVATLHYPRGGEDAGPWSAVTQPWDYPREYDGPCRGQLPPAINNEPIGPKSSGAEEDDPLRLVLAYVMTFVSQNAAHVVHAGAGIRGGGVGDMALGRRANLFEVAGLDAALRGMKAARGYLPHDLANWTRQEPQKAAFPFEGFTRNPHVRAYAAVRDDRFVLAVLDLTQKVTVTARRATAVEVIDPVSGAPLQRMNLRAGEAMTLEPRARHGGGDGVVVVGRYP